MSEGQHSKYLISICWGFFSEIKHTRGENGTRDGVLWRATEQSGERGGVWEAVRTIFQKGYG